MKVKLLDAVKEKTVKDVVHYFVDSKMDGQIVNEENIEQCIQERLTSNIAYYKYNFTDYQFISAKKEIKKDVDNIMGMFDLAEIDDTDSYNEAFKEWSNKAFGNINQFNEQTEKSKTRKKTFIEILKDNFDKNIEQGYEVRFAEIHFILCGVVLIILLIICFI